jgi:predicted phosphodiesterase
MRVAALYDIHGNVPALESVLVAVATAGVDAILIGGDVAEGPQPVETLDLLESVDIPLRWLRGNCDREPSEWVGERLGERRVAWLAALPPTDRIDIPGLGPVLFCHGSPRSDEECVTERTPPDRVREFLDGVPERAVVTAHTHVAYERVVDGVRLLNPGSVGMPYEGSPVAAYWAVLGQNVSHRRTEYDVERAVELYRASGDPRAEEMVELLLAPPSREEAIAHAESVRFAG